MCKRVRTEDCFQCENEYSVFLYCIVMVKTPPDILSPAELDQQVRVAMASYLRILPVGLQSQVI
jgi:hypothetical protein